MRMFRSEAGFTLMEIMIAVGIIALMIGVVTVGLSGAGHKGRLARAKADIKAFEGAIQNYENDNGAIPTSDQGLQSLIEGGYLNKRKLPNDPWKSPYVYVVPGPDNMPFDIVSYGKDKAEGGEAENQDIKLSEIE